MNTIDCVQGDALWFEARVGHVTSSRVADAVAVLKRSKDEAACRKNLRCDLVSERLTKKPIEHFVSKYMLDGIEREPLARAAYELRTNTMVTQVGFVLHPAMEWCGASPDGLIGASGLLEIKCPKVTTHIDYLLAETVPEDYQPQMLWQMACCEREFNDFVSFCPDMPEELQLFICRLPRDDARIANMEGAVTQFLVEVDAMIARLRRGLTGTLRMSIARERAGLEVTQEDIATVV